MAFEAPDWLEEGRISDDAFKNAYECVPTPCRCALKTAIALSSLHFTPETDIQKTVLENNDAGFWLEKTTCPADWAIIVFDAGYDACARVCAAAVLPALAGIKNIAAICVDGQPVPGALLALELCGIEDVFHLPTSRLPDLADFLASPSLGSGVITTLYHPSLAQFGNIALEAGLDVHAERPDPRILLLEPQYFERQLLVFAHGADILTRAATQAPYAAFCSAETARQDCPAPLALTPGCECFWLFPHLDMTCFRTGSKAFGVLPKAAIDDI